MCRAFSCVCKGSGAVVWRFGTDSHEDLLALGGLRDVDVTPNFARVEITPDNRNYLYPDKWTLRIDERATPTWWSPAYEAACWDAHKAWLAKLDTVLVRKPVVHPFRDVVPPKRITKKHLTLLRKWAGARGSVQDSVEDSVEDSVQNSVEDSVQDSVQDSVWDSLWDSVQDSLWDSVWAYAGSFFSLSRDAWLYTENIPGAGYPFQPAVDLWEMGLVPSFDGEVWRLHGGPEGKALWKGKLANEEEEKR